MERRYAGGKAEQLPGLAAELVALKVDVIHATSGTAALAAKNATGTIPIVALSGDMIAQGLVSNLARPDANVTGQNMMLVELAGKRLYLLRELLPRASRVAVFGCGPGANMDISWPSVEAANKSLKLELLQYTPQTEDEVGIALKDATSRRANGLLVLDCPRYNSIDKTALPASLPVEQPTRLRLVINLKTAKALGLTIPSSLLLRADQVIE